MRTRWKLCLLARLKTRSILHTSFYFNREHSRVSNFIFPVAKITNGTHCYWNSWDSTIKSFAGREWKLFTPFIKILYQLISILSRYFYALSNSYSFFSWRLYESFSLLSYRTYQTTKQVTNHESTRSPWSRFAIQFRSASNPSISLPITASRRYRKGVRDFRRQITRDALQVSRSVHKMYGR